VTKSALEGLLFFSRTAVISNKVAVSMRRELQHLFKCSEENYSRL